MNSTKNILIISTEFPPGPGGIGSHAFSIASGFQSHGWEVTVVTEQNYATDNEIEDFNKNQKLNIIRLFPSPSLFTLFVKIIKLMNVAIREKNRVIIGTGKHGSWFAFIVAKLLFKKCILIGHGTEFSISMSKKSKRINKFIYSHANGLISVSDYTAEVTRKEGIRNKKMKIIHNGADGKNYFKLDTKYIEEFKTNNSLVNQRIIVTVGNLSNRKGQEWVIRSLPNILKHHPTTHYYCIGLPTLEHKLTELSKELGVENHVHIMGRLDLSEVRLWLNTCDLFAMTSVHDSGDFEGFGISVIEAALCGKTSIVTNESGVIESIVQNYTGFGVPERNPEAIAEKVNELFSNENLLQKFNLNAYNRANKNYTWENQIKEYIDYLQNA